MINYEGYQLEFQYELDGTVSWIVQGDGETKRWGSESSLALAEQAAKYAALALRVRTNRHNLKFKC